MQVIPVIDLKNGQVVHAQRGQRDAYAPIQSGLCTSADAHSVVQGLLKLYPFRIIYIADIDAICGNGNHADLVADLAHQHPDITWWLDNGNASTPPLQTNIHAVIGTESITTLAQYQAINTAHILSLDQLNGQDLGCATLHQDSALWPQHVIAMSLNKVGSQQGPDFTRLQQLQAQAPQASIYAAGGVKHAQDLHALSKLGIAGVLVATALHNGSINTNELQAFS